MRNHARGTRDRDPEHGDGNPGHLAAGLLAANREQTPARKARPRQNRQKRPQGERELDVRSTQGRDEKGGNAQQRDQDARLPCREKLSSH